MPVERLALGPLFLFGQLPCVAVPSGARFLFGRALDVEEPGTERFHLLSRLGAYVVRRDDGAETTGRGDRLQPGHSCAEDEDLRRAHGARRGGQHREEPVVRVRRDQRRLVTGDTGLGGQRVHGLGAAEGTGQQIEAHRAHTASGQLLDRHGVSQRFEQTDQGLPRAQRGRALRVRRAHAQDSVRAFVQFVRGYDVRACRRVVGVGEPCAGSGSGLYEDVESGPAQEGDGLGDEGDTAFAGCPLPYGSYSDGSHGLLPLPVARWVPGHRTLRTRRRAALRPVRRGPRRRSR